MNSGSETKSSPPPESGRGSRPATAAVVGICAGLAVVALVAAGYVIGNSRGHDNGGGTSEATKTTDAQASGPGQQAFAEKCGSCHTLSAAGTSGQVGPNLDQLKPQAPVTLAQIKNGGGAMPAGLASGEEAKQIAEYVAKAAGS